MRKKDIDHLLEIAVARALGVQLAPARPRRTPLARKLLVEVRRAA